MFTDGFYKPVLDAKVCPVEESERQGRKPFVCDVLVVGGLGLTGDDNIGQTWMQLDSEESRQGVLIKPDAGVDDYFFIIMGQYTPRVIITYVHALMPPATVDDILVLFVLEDEVTGY